MSLEVNHGEGASTPPAANQEAVGHDAPAIASRREPAAAPAREAVAERPLAGQLRRSRSGGLRLLQWVTGLALLLWLGRGVAWLLGYRHSATLTLTPGGLELRGTRAFLGMSLGRTRELIPLAAVRRVSVVGSSALWAVLAALVALVLGGAAGTVLVLWGLSGRQPSWIALGAAIVGGAMFLDAVAYLLVRRAVARAMVTLEVRAAGRRCRLGHVAQRSADRLLDRLASGSLTAR